MGVILYNKSSDGYNFIVVGDILKCVLCRDGLIRYWVFFVYWFYDWFICFFIGSGIILFKRDFCIERKDVD